MTRNLRNRYGEEALGNEVRIFPLKNRRAAVVAPSSIGLPLKYKPKSMQQLDFNNSPNPKP